MRKFQQNKLWRDGAPDKLRATGSIIHVMELSDAEFDAELRLKLLEEAEEVRVTTSRADLVDEIADVYDVLEALCSFRGISHNEIIAAQKIKFDKRGGFKKKQYVTIAEHLEGSWGEEYCLADPEKYPEIID